jgi:superfamily I DNA/RNA helicase
MRNILTDELQDVTTNTGEFIKACMAENRHRIEIEGGKEATMSVFACGDDFQTAHGTQGATPKYLTEFRHHFPSKGYVMNLLGHNFRSQQGIIFAAHSLVLGIPAVSTYAPASAASEENFPVEVFDLTGGTFMRLFDMHYGAGDSILILAANPDDYKAFESVVNVAVDRDKEQNPESRRVRVRAAQRSKGLEADTVFIIGDFFAANSTWAKNQIFRLARTVATDDQSPFDVIQQNELYRLAHIGITRARKKCVWLIGKEAVDVGHRLKASNRISGAKGCFMDHR